MPLCPVACRRPWVVVGSVRAVVCRRSAWRPDRLATCPLRSGKRSRSCELRAPGCVTLPVGSGRAPSTVSRELRRNAATRSGGLAYRASTAQWHSARRAKRPKIAKLAANDRLRSYVQDRLAGTVMAEDGTPVPGPNVGSWSGRRHGRRQDRHWATSWSPQQIAHRLRIEYPNDDSMRVSHEAIYQALYIQGRGALRRELTACLRTGRALSRPHSTADRGRLSVGKPHPKPSTNCYSHTSEDVLRRPLEPGHVARRGDGVTSWGGATSRHRRADQPRPRRRAPARGCSSGSQAGKRHPHDGWQYQGSRLRFGPSVGWWSR